MTPRDLDARLAWSRKRLRQRQRKPLARHAGEACGRDLGQGDGQTGNAPRGALCALWGG